MSEAHPAVEVVTYDGLPAASGGAHRLRTRNPRLAWEAVQSFLDACVLPAGDPTVTLVVWKGGQPGPSGNPWPPWCGTPRSASSTRGRASRTRTCRPRRSLASPWTGTAASSARPACVRRSGRRRHRSRSGSACPPTTAWQLRHDISNTTSRSACRPNTGVAGGRPATDRPTARRQSPGPSPNEISQATTGGPIASSRSTLPVRPVADPRSDVLRPRLPPACRRVAAVSP